MSDVATNDVVAKLDDDNPLLGPDPTLPTVPLPAELEDILFYGFDAKTWSFCIERDYLFEPNYSKKQTIPWIRNQMQQIFAYPDGTRISTQPISGDTRTESFHGQHSTREEDLTTAFSTSLSLEGISAGVESTLATKSGVETAKNTRTSIAAAYKISYTLVRVEKEPGDASPAFLDALEKLPNSSDEATSFLKKWGTHFLSKAAFGGTWWMKVSLSEDNTATSSDTEFEAKVSSGFSDAMGADAKTQVDIKKRVAESLKITSVEKAVEINAIGGITTATHDEWNRSVPDSPALLYNLCSLLHQNPEVRPIFEPIWNLIDDKHPRKDLLKKAWSDYLPLEEAVQFGTPSHPVFDTNIRADSEGFLCVTTGTAESKDSGNECRLFSDSSAQPQRLVGAAAVQTHWAIVSAVPIAPEPVYNTAAQSAFVPIRAADYFRIDTAVHLGSAGDKVAEFQPFRLGLGQWTEEAPSGGKLSPGTLYTSAADGFLLVIVGAQKADSQCACDIVGYQDTAAGFIPVCAASMAWVPSTFATIGCASFCMPVAKGLQFQVNLCVASNLDAPIITMQWIPMVGRQRMGNAQQINPVTAGSQAKTNGILFGTLYASDSDSNYQGDLILRATPDPTFIGGRISRSQVFATTPWYVRPTPIRCGAACIAVSEGSWYHAEFASSGTDQLSASAHWVPITLGD